MIGCEACQKLISWIRSPPIDDWVVDLFNLSVMQACLADYDPATCQNAIEMERQRLKDGLFAVFFTEARICGSLFPVCEVAYSPLEPKDYATRVLSEKPAVIVEDNYLDQLYAKIEEEGRSGKKIPTYRVLQISDWHLDLDY